MNNPTNIPHPIPRKYTKVSIKKYRKPILMQQAPVMEVFAMVAQPVLELPKRPVLPKKKTVLRTTRKLPKAAVVVPRCSANMVQSSASDRIIWPSRKGIFLEHLSKYYKQINHNSLGICFFHSANPSMEFAGA